MSKLPASFTPARHFTQRAAARDAADFLQGNDKLAALLPAAARLASLQRECVAMMPTPFAHCTVLQITDGQLQIAVPNAALATRIKQLLPKLQAGLSEKGWPIESIKLKIQVVAPPLPAAVRELSLPAGAVSSFAELDKNLDAHPRNEALKAALHNLVERRRKKPQG
jgi:hypothetical protein